jgi:hypothetical protein
MTAPFVHEQGGFQSTAERQRFGAFAVGALKVAQFVGLEPDPERHEHYVRSVSRYDPSVFWWEARKLLIHRYIPFVTQSVSFMSAATI